MPLQPWYKVVVSREDLRDGKPLDASESAVHLDHVRDHRTPVDYQNPERFFAHAFLTKNPLDTASQVVRRLSGIKTETTLGRHFAPRIRSIPPCFQCSNENGRPCHGSNRRGVSCGCWRWVRD